MALSQRRGIIAAPFFIFLSFFFFQPAAASEAPAPNFCVDCHGDIADETAGSIHTRQAVSCSQCHGGDPTKDDMEAAKAPGTGFLGRPDKKQVVETCGSCHADIERMNFYGIRTDQLARYKTSHHGKALLEKGNTDVAACTDCHGSHHVLPVADPNSPVYPLNLPKTCARCHSDQALMDAHNLPSDALKKYESSVHGRALFEKKDLSVANCASCHGSHGAVPPGVKDVATTCGKCHVNERKYFLESPHAELEKQGRFSECVSCHGNHAVEPADIRLFQTACVKCHAQTAPLELGLEIARSIGDAEEQLAKTSQLVKQASIEGFFVEEEGGLLEEMKTGVVEMKPLQHTLSSAKMEELNTRVTAGARSVEAKIREKRRNVLWRKQALVAIWIFILVMVAALWTQYNRVTAGKHKR